MRHKPAAKNSSNHKMALLCIFSKFSRHLLSDFNYTLGITSGWLTQIKGCGIELLPPENSSVSVFIYINIVSLVSWQCE